MSEEDFTNDFSKGDGVCNTCFGLTYYDAVMQAKKLPFTCYGIRGTSEEESATVIEKGIKEYTAEFESYACLGKAISTGRMERQGIVPIRMFGIESDSRRENRTKRNEQRNNMLRERQMTLDAQNEKKTSEGS